MSCADDPSPDERPLAWGEDGQPRSRLYGDVYFSTTDGLAETRAVFLEGCGLPGAWAGRDRFVVGELGFGTGLNIAALLDLWARERPPGARLHVFSIEAHPLTRDEAARALSAWPQIAPTAQALLARWPGRARGFHRLDLPQFDALIDIAVMDVAEALEAWSGRADAWLLDGFSPALNPAMWREEVLSLVAARSAPGARAATFTVAGAVRRGLVQAGFEVEKKPGFGRKRERLEARLGAAAPARTGAARRIAIVGAGVSGASAARAVRALGGEPVLIEARYPGAGASGNPAALVTPRLDAGGGPPSRLYAQAFARAVRLYEDAPGAVIARGVLQFASEARDLDRFGRIAASDQFEPGDLALLSAEAVAARLGERAPAALDQRTALVIEPARVLAAWARDTVPGQVARLDPAASGWRAVGPGGEVLAEADAVILACALAARDLAPELPLAPLRGQASWVETDLQVPAAGGDGYVLPTRTGVLFGATHDRDDDGVDVRDADHARNLALLARSLPRLAERLRGLGVDGRAAIRAVTPDRLPLAGRAPVGPDGLFLLTGFGSRGFTHAPLLAEHVAACALGAPSPLPQPLAALVDPGRFRLRAARRGRS